ncbi:hypothetical protein M413DRAFT_446377 [Hebeloma cylindrosporum]|uniref:Gelsolin repeat protein n=1 Tax=Hebeloma cylindrosporum TaxID=76867 RepID=A0A0C3C9H0_HEBCY|nr:hypothetical protein M413DRAFT_446377 [Hebeloma cylindrosporum h7]
MDSSFSSSPRRAYDSPKPETGLAEWTSKIKALQREVDADEEAEQKRLEEEIAAARQARLRRSRGAGGGSRVDSLDMSSNKELLQRLETSNDTTFNDAPKSIDARKIDQETALRKLMGRNEVYNPDKTVSSSRPALDRSGSDSVSLAAFIGGRATGPRLNRHAPQPDAHDPTQFIQPDLSAPHPVFGRGGVAMPGMAAKKESKPIIGSDLSETYRPSTSVNAKPTSGSTPSTYGARFAPKLDEPSIPDRIDLKRRSFTSATKEVIPSVAQRYTESIAPSTEKDSTSAPKTFQEAPMNVAGASSAQPTNTYKFTAPSAAPLISVRKSPSFTSLNRKDESSLPSTKPLNVSRSNGPSSTFNAAAKPPLAPFSKKDEAVTPGSRVPSSKTLDISRSTPATSFNAVSKTPSFTSLSKKEEPPSPPLFSSTKPLDNPVVSKQGSGNSDTPLHRLMERNKVFNPDKLTADPARKSIAERAQSVSLAGFIGGSAGGPRLNRHAPQPDAHDPTQFVQPDTSAPHPIFGKGGIAMPGMSARKGTDPGLESSERYQPSSTAKPKWPPVKTIHDIKAGRPVSPQKTNNRERTTSAPGAALATPSIAHSSSWSSSTPSASGQTPTKGVRPITPVRDRTISGPSYSQSALNSYESSRSSISPSPFSRSSISTLSLNRPIQPQSKTTSVSPKIPIMTTLSPAFQKPPPPKDLTPSISRLQGRGFVQNMVKVSANLESSPSPSDRARPTSAGGRKSSVLDRWQPNTQPNTQSPSPTKSSYPIPLRRSTTQVPSDSPIDNPRSSSIPPLNGNGIHSIKTVASLPSMSKAASAPSRIHTEEPQQVEDPYPRSRTPGLGSATTMVLIKPKKSATDLTQLSHIDEHGMKHNFGRDEHKEESRYHTPPPLPSSPKKPLIHTTEDRARKRMKMTDPPSGAKELLQVVDVVPTEPMDEAPPIFSNPPAFHSISIISKDPEVSSRDVAPFQPEVDISSEWNVVQAGHQRDAKTPSSPPRKLSVSTQEEHVDPISRAKSTSPSPEVNPAHPPKAQAFGPISPVERTPSSGPLLPDPSPICSPPSSPSKHSRIPSTGKRPTVMQVAQDFLNPPKNEFHADPIISEPEVKPPESPLKPRATLSQMQAEKRKSSYERYSVMVLPPLKEEATPTPSPAGTLTRGTARLDVVLPSEQEKQSKSLEVPMTKEPEMSSSTSPVDSEKIQVSFPEVNISKLLNSPVKPFEQPPDILTISVEVLAITGTTATPLSRNLDIFYDSEILAIVHRTKSKSTGLASTTVWCWLGRRSLLGDREERKIHELSKRYGTSAKILHQLAEPAALIQTLGGRLAIRQGTRTHWSPENTSMHLVRSFSGVIIIDEHDLNIKNLCSAFSYCVTLLGSVYVWHGRGSTVQERAAALKYTETFSVDVVSPVELIEDEDDNDEMFWMILGDDTFAKADYWQWRGTFNHVDPSIWRIELSNEINPAISVPFISMEKDLQNSIYLLNCIWEIFVLVGKEARSNKLAIRFALDVGMQLSKESATSRPYTPTVHVLILPSQIPLDLRLGIRDLDEAWLNDGEIPDHMNLLPYSEAVDHLSISTWVDTSLKDSTMLPLGVGVGSTKAQ